ncbi:MAG TPA: translation initiation factor IF-2 [Acidimicrobiales bacterium]|nr:translation initiation factor IF-2 [Acidimicrobiales bacterium]
MPKNPRVHELAKELGLTNKELLDLCEQLGIGVKSHSSSIQEAQADRVRRKADQLGIRREEQPEEPKKVPAKKAAAKKAVAKKPEVKKPEVPAEPAPEPPVAEEPAAEPPAAGAPEAEPPAPQPEPEPELAPVIELPVREPEETPSPAVSAPAALAEAESTPAHPAAPAARREIRSSGTQQRQTAAPPPAAPSPAAPSASGPPRPAARQAPAASPGEMRPPRPQTPPSPGADATAPAAQSAPAPVSPSGRPIPPPPGGAPLSSTGKPIPPPPGQGGRGPTPPRSSGGPGTRSSGPSMRPAGGQRPPSSGGPGGGFGGRGGGFSGRPGGGPGGGPAGGPGGGPGPGGRGGPPNRRTPRPRKGGRRRRNREELQPFETPTYTHSSAPIPEGVVVIERSTTPQELGPKLNRTAADVVRFLMQQGEMVTATQSLTDDMIELFAAEVGAEIHLVNPGQEQEVELQKLLDLGDEEDEDEGTLADRPPVITVMGHVDHGKTKLLDYIRNANVVAGEAGGITQHIGAYQVDKNGRTITFIDTPGHEAFTAMRARGAQATDIVVLVVAADDGVMPQTVEALNHAKAADVPIVVAINKIDREQANPERVMQQLSEQGLIPTQWNGDTEMVQVSALQGLGVDDLLDTLLLTADVEDLKANPDGRAQGVVLEAHLDVGRGPVATVLVQRGTLKVGDALVAGPAWGRVRAMINDQGEQVREAGPSTPVEVLGLSDVADAGDDFVVAPDERVARNVAETREHWQRVANLGRDAHAMSTGARLEDIFDQIQSGEAATLNLVVKADVTGSLEALTGALQRLERDDVKLSFVHRAVGGITQYDIQLAAASNATIIGFNVRPDRKARELAEREGVEIRTYEIIYQVIEDIENAMLGLLAPEFEEVVTGEAEVREVFSVPRVGRVAGCYVQSGTITRGSKVRFLREGTIIWKGSITSLKRFKDDAREVQAGYECGIGLSDFQDLKAGDIIETYEDREIPRT